MRSTLQPILDLLDDGLRLYRREFAHMAIIAAIGALPGIIVVILILRRPELLASTAGIFAFYGVGLLALPLSIYLMGAISRATLASIEGRPVLLRESLAIGPLRLLGMGCYGGVYLALLNMAVSMLGVFCFCPLFFVIGMASAGISNVLDGSSPLGAAMAGLVMTVLVVLFVLLYGLGLVLSGASYGSLVFSLQPFVHGKLRIGQALQRSIDMTFYRFGANLLAYFCASLIFGALVLSITLAIGVLVPLPLLFLIGAESSLAQGLSAAAVIAGMTLALPPLPIWMALLYQRRLAEREGADLGVRIAAFAESSGFGYAEDRSSG